MKILYACERRDTCGYYTGRVEKGYLSCKFGEDRCRQSFWELVTCSGDDHGDPDGYKIGYCGCWWLRFANPIVRNVETVRIIGRQYD